MNLKMSILPSLQTVLSTEPSSPLNFLLPPFVVITFNIRSTHFTNVSAFSTVVLTKPAAQRSVGFTHLLQWKPCAFDQHVPDSISSQPLVTIILLSLYEFEYFRFLM